MEELFLGEFKDSTLICEENVFGGILFWCFCWGFYVGGEEGDLFVCFLYALRELEMGILPCVFLG
jgi:hypothetical protein